MPQELYFLTQLLSGASTGWVYGVLLGGLFAVLIFRPERIRNRPLFLLACWFLALAILVPPLLNFLLLAILSGPGMGPMGMSNWLGGRLLGGIVGLCGPGFCGLGAIFALLALMPGRAVSGSVAPPKHPLEE